jgi:environmental stress-induced protein Ves
VALRHLPAAARRATPWKNGGGVTYEIAAYPPDAGLDAFDWRISTARVESDGPFSVFPGVDRVLLVLSGTLVLQFGAGDAVVLTDASAPFGFSGEAPCDGRLSGGPVVDLNIMVRRGRAHAQVMRIMTPAPIMGGSAELVLITLDACVLNGQTLSPLDAVIAEPADPIQITGPWPRLVAVALASPI